jgi:hypothetical protein
VGVAAFFSFGMLRREKRNPIHTKEGCSALFGQLEELIFKDPLLLSLEREIAIKVRLILNLLA